MQRGDIYLVDLNPTSGFEQQGRRPVLIVSPGAFNTALNTPLIAPITNGGGPARAMGFTVPLDGSGTRTTGVVLCNQIRALDIGSRNGRYLESVTQDVINEVLARIEAIIT